MTDIRAAQKAVKALSDYFDLKSSSPLTLAMLVSTIPDPIQEGIFEFCLNYFREVAGRTEFYGYSGNMQHYSNIARDMLK